ncbi:hypothetical protein M422DRAFT_773635 [Sphaerobolus stellatus SS14]|nr:hypothetical protein M422DRAFT_773635 [Sphaerobolus stellatus SS14]
MSTPTTEPPSQRIVNTVMDEDSGRPKKRQRSNTVTKSFDDLKRSSICYLEDGNIVLAVEETAFRVHRSVFSKHSDVFRDMFLNAVPPQEEGRTYDGCPVIELTDHAEDVATLLKSIYENRQYSEEKTIHLARLLKMSNKYLMGSVYDRVFKSLQQRMPDNFEKFKRHFLQSDVQPMPIELAIAVAEAAMTTGTDVLLPSLLYNFCRVASTEQLGKLPPAIVAKVAAGKQNLSFAMLRFVADVVKKRTSASSPCYSGNCRAAWALIKDLMDDNIYGSMIRIFNPLRVYAHILSLGDRLSECPKCRAERTQVFQNECEKVWNDLPKMFGLGENWEDLRKKSQRSPSIGPTPVPPLAAPPAAPAG